MPNQHEGGVGAIAFVDELDQLLRITADLKVRCELQLLPGMEHISDDLGSLLRPNERTGEYDIECELKREHSFGNALHLLCTLICERALAVVVEPRCSSLDRNRMTQNIQVHIHARLVLRAVVSIG